MLKKKQQQPTVLLLRTMKLRDLDYKKANEMMQKACQNLQTRSRLHENNEKC